MKSCLYKYEKSKPHTLENLEYSLSFMFESKINAMNFMDTFVENLQDDINDFEFSFKFGKE